MTRLHLKYKLDTFNPRLIELTERFLDEGPWDRKKGLPTIERMYDTWAHGACIVYGLPYLKVSIIPDKSAVGRYLGASELSEIDPEFRGMFMADERTNMAIAVLAKPSLVSLFHQFRHHMQECSKAEEPTLDDEGNPIVAYKSDKEAAVDAQQWACSLFYCLRPKMFRKAVRAGRIAGVSAPDLLKKARKSK